MSDTFLAIIKEDAADPLPKMKEFFRTVPQPNRFILQYLFRFLARVIEHSAVNKMVASNIVTVFASNFLQFTNQTESMMLSKSINDWVACAIKHQDDVFDEPVEFPGRSRHSTPRRSSAIARSTSTRTPSATSLRCRN